MATRAANEADKRRGRTDSSCSSSRPECRRAAKASHQLGASKPRPPATRILKTEASNAMGLKRGAMCQLISGLSLIAALALHDQLGCTTAAEAARAQLPVLDSPHLDAPRGSSFAIEATGPGLASSSSRDPSARPLVEHQASSSRQVASPAKVCQVNDGESVAIVEIEESRGSDTSQPTRPVELPIGGSVESGEIELRIESETHKYFHLQDKRLRLSRPLDRDPQLRENSTQIGQQAVASIYLQISCTDRRNLTGARPQTARKVIIPVLVKVLDVNDNAPKFSQPLYSVQVDELTPVNTIVLDQILAVDLDSANNGQIEYSLLGARSPASQRLIQRAQPAAGQSAIDAATTTTVATASGGGRDESLTAATAASVAATSILSPATSTSLPPLSLVEAKQTVPTSVAPALTQAATTVAPKQQPTTVGRLEELDEQQTSTTRNAPRANEPTFNLNSEPILNGPMEDMGDEENDEALLASLAANSTGNPDQAEPEEADSLASGDFAAAAASLVGSVSRRRYEPLRPAASLANGENSHPPGKRRRRARRSSDDRPPPAPTTVEPSGRQRAATTQAPPAYMRTATDKTEIPNQLRSHEKGDSTARAKQQQQQQQRKDLLPWTNLMLADDGPTGDSANANWRPPAESTRQPDAGAHFEDNDYFSLEYSASQAGGSLRPVLRLKRPLDYEHKRLHKLTVVATDQAANKADRLSSRATIYVHVLDGDDQPPAFVLDQSGCATNSLPQATTPASGLWPASPGAKSEASAPPLGADRSLKISDENLDFGDTLALDDSPIEELSAPSRARRIVSVLPSPNQTTAAPTSGIKDYYQCLVSSSSSSASGQTVAGGQLAEYFATVVSGDSEYLLRVVPQAIKARDRDELNAPIRYSFLNGTLANFHQYFQINPLDASIKQIAPLERANTQLVLWVQAQEVSANRLFSLAKLTIDVLPSDRNPPVLLPNSYAGFVEENSPVRTRVLATLTNGERAYLQVSVLDGDAPQLPATNATPSQNSAASKHAYEFESTSEAFRVDRDGFVYVNQANLDRDAPNQQVHMFQVTARLPGLMSSRSVSSPISLNVSLLDVNDNPPVLLNETLGPIQMAANPRGGAQLVTRLAATDRDQAENSRARFSLRHVSNNGLDRFRVDEDSGRVEALGKFGANEQFSLTVQACDELARCSQGIVEVLVVPGANTGGPQFVVDGGERDNARGYSVEVNEGVSVGSIVLQVHAVDPENDPISYSLIGDGNTNGDFAINSRTGQLSVANKLDREEISAYKLLVQARDSGGLATSRPIQVTVSDANDQNPTFAQPSYVFSCHEGVASQPVGRVTAQDGDSGDNGRVSYSLRLLEPQQAPDERPLFSIDEQSGQVRLLEPLDYERAHTYTLLVTASDHGEHARTSTVGVQVQVLDVQDELPYFERPRLEVRLDENQAGQRVALVQARDPDSVARVSYVLLAGDSQLFQVDAQTGAVSTGPAGLDYERSRAHTLLVGTSEAAAASDFDLVELANRLAATSSQEARRAPDGQRWPAVRIDVQVGDLNDNAPRFDAAQPAPVRIQDSAQLGSTLTRLAASDRDGSSPNNQIRYQLVTERSARDEDDRAWQQRAPVTSDKCAQLFMVESSSGAVLVRSDLKREPQSECQLIVEAHDLALDVNQRLSSATSLTVFIDHPADTSYATMIGFADASFTVELSENSPANLLVKTLHVVNKPRAVSFPMSCELLSGNELNKFYVIENEQRDCELRTRDSSLDFEVKSKYTLLVRLNTIGASSGPTSSAGGGGGGSNGAASGAAAQRTVAQVQVNILDKNDNRPVFYPSARYGHLTQNKFLAAIPFDSPPETQVIQLRAFDGDSVASYGGSPNGLIAYELLADEQQPDQPEARFKVDPVDGIVRTGRPLEDLPSAKLPIKLRVLARDNPTGGADQTAPANGEPTQESVAEVLVNLIDDRHRIVLALKDSPASRVLDSREELLGALQERTGLISGLERVESLKLQKNSTSLEADVTGADFWFHLIEPGTFRIVANDDPRVKAALFNSRSLSSLADVISQKLGFSKAKIRLPYALTSSQLAGSLAGRSTSSLLLAAIRGGDSGDRLAPALIMIAVFIAITSVLVVIYQCGSAAGNRGSLDQHHHQAAMLAAKEKLFAASNNSAFVNYFNEPQSILGGLSQRGATFNPIQDPFTIHHRRSETLTSQQTNACGQQQQLIAMTPPPPRATDGVIGSKEYETQMLKMSVLFDDNHSLEEQNGKQIISKNLV